MNTTPTPDYGEPWDFDEENWVTDVDNIEVLNLDSIHSKYANRLVACVNACAGMADPSKEIEAMRNKLNTLRWIPLTERLPTIEDGNGFEDVEWSDGHEIWQGNYKNSRRHSPTHWRRITLP